MHSPFIKISPTFTFSSVKILLPFRLPAKTTHGVPILSKRLTRRTDIRPTGTTIMKTSHRRGRTRSLIAKRTSNRRSNQILLPMILNAGSRLVKIRQSSRQFWREKSSGCTNSSVSTPRIPMSIRGIRNIIPPRLMGFNKGSRGIGNIFVLLLFMIGNLMVLCQLMLRFFCLFIHMVVWCLM